MQLNVREPRENRGRLRHCNGIQVPPQLYQMEPWETPLIVKSSGRQEQGLSPESGYRLICARQGCVCDAPDFSDKEKDEARFC